MNRILVAALAALLSGCATTAAGTTAGTTPPTGPAGAAAHTPAPASPDKVPVSSWKEVAHGYLASIQPALDPAPLRAIAAELKPASGDPKDVATAALDWTFHHLRFTGVRFGEGNLVPRPAADLLRLGAGDDHDLAAFLVALLGASGVDAKLALVLDAPRADGPDDAPGLQHFNHALVYIPGEHPLWIDPTLRGAEPGVLTHLSSDRMALLIDSGGDVRVRTPIGSAAQNRAEIRTEITVPAFGRGTVRTVRTIGGTSIPWRRMRALSQSDDELQQEMAAEVEALDGTRDFTYRHSDPLAARPLEETLEIRNAGRAVAGDVDVLVHLHHEMLAELLPEELHEPDSDETADLFVGTPRELEMVTRVHTHPLYTLGNGAVSQEGSAGGLSWSYAIEPRPDGAEARLLLRLDRRVIAAADLHAVRASLEQLAQLANQLQFDNSIGKRIEAGEVAAAAAELRQLTKANPRDGWVRALQARLALHVGLGAEARRLAREAVKLAPDSTPVLRTLAAVLVHDDWSRTYAEGMDRKGALAALARVREFEPEERGNQKQQIAVLARNDLGQIGGTGADVTRALEELRSYRSAGNHDEDQLYLQLLWSQRLDAELAAAKAQYPWYPLVVAAIARDSGADEAARWVEGQPNEERESLLAAATFELYQARDYPIALALSMHVSDPQMAELRQMIGRLHKREEQPLRFDRPIDLLVETMAHALHLPVRADAARLGLTPDVRRSIQFEKAGGIDRTGGDKAPVLDWIQANVPVDQESIPGVGVLATFYFDPRAGTRILFQQTGDGLRFHPVVTPDARIVEAWKSWDAGDLERTRRWLDVQLRITPDPALVHGESMIRERMAGSREDVALAIALSTTEGSAWMKRAVPVLERAYRKLGVQDGAMDLRLTYVTALMSVGRYDQALSAIDKLEDAGLFPNGDLPQFFRAAIFTKAGRSDALDTLGKETLRHEPNSESGLRMVAAAARLRGDWRAFRELQLKMAELGIRPEESRDNAVRASLFLGVTAEDIRDAERAVRGGAENTDSLETLAVLLAEKGEVDRALGILDQIRHRTVRTVPSPAVVFARARIAEELGWTEAARALYGRVEKEPESVLQPLARKKLERLRRVE